jgi:hypothetical protein
VIRLWSRVGPFRALSMFVLVLGILGGVALADRQTQQQEAAAAANATLASPSEQETTDQLDAQRKADDAASAAAARIAAAEEVARQSKPASRSTPRATGPIGPPGAPVGPIPPECSAAYVGHRATGCALLRQAGWSMDEMVCLNKLWNKESNWRVEAYNKSSGAMGIPQAVPGTKMAKFGSDYRTSAATQIRWGLSYIRGRHGSPCGAWAHSQSKGWY